MTKEMSRKIVLTAFLVSWVNFFAFSQIVETDETTVHLDSISTDTGKVNRLNEWAFAHRHINARKTKMYAEKAYQLANMIDYETGKAMSYRNMGFYFRQKGAYGEAIDYFLKALRLYKYLGDEEGASSNLGSIATVYRRKGNYAKALKYYFKALKAIKKQGDEYLKAKCHVNIGIVYYYRKDYATALKHCFEALEVFEKYEKQWSISNVLGVIAKIYRDKKEYELALKEASRALAISQKIEAKELIADNTLMIVSIQSRQGEQANVLDKYFQVLKIYEKAENNEKVIITLSLIAEVYLKQQAYFFAEKYALQAFTMAEEKGLKEIMKSEGEFLTQVYLQQGNYIKAFEYQSITMKMKDTLLNAKEAEKILQMRVQYESRKKEQENELLKEHASLNKKIIKKQYLLFFAALGGFSVVLVLALMLHHSNVQKNMTNRLLTDKTQRIENQNILLQNKNIQLRESKNLIEEQAKKLRKTDEMKSRMFANISHEFRTPLSLILIPTESALQEEFGKLDPVLKQHLETIQRYSKDLLILIEEILELSKLETDKNMLHCESVYLWPLVQQIAANFESQAAHLKIQLTIRLEGEEDIFGLIDVGRWKKILNNLLSNAMKFTPSGGKISVLVKEHEKYIETLVTDTGAGISSEDLPYIFDRFYSNAANNDGLRQSSSGIGLALAKELALQHGGDLQTTSKLGEGSTFSLILPKPSETEKLKPIREFISTPAQNVSFDNVSGFYTTQERTRHFKVLVVEDNKVMRNYITQILQAHFYMQEAKSAKDALEILQHIQPDLIISDLMMPEIDGGQFVELLKREEKWKTIPLIILTALAEEENKLQILTMGVDDYLTKPFSPKELLIRSANLLQNAQNRQRTHIEHQNTEMPEAEPLPVSFKEEFIQRFQAVVQMYMKDTKLNILSIAHEMAVSERQLHRKTQSMTGFTPARLVREIRLLEARKLLINRSKQNLSEVAYSVGFKSASYFGNLYEKRFGKHPSEYLQK